VVDNDARILIAADRAARHFHRQREVVAAVTRDRNEDRRMATEAGEMRPGDINRAVLRQRDGFMIGYLAVGAAGLTLSLECADQCECRVAATATRGPGPAAVVRAAEPERHVLSFVAEAGEVRGAAVGTERDGGVAAEVVRSGARDCRIVRKRRDAGDESIRQRRRPGLAAVERRIDAAAVVVVPVIVAGD